MTTLSKAIIGFIFFISAAMGVPAADAAPRLSAGCQVKGKPTGQLQRTDKAAGGKSGRKWSFFVPDSYNAANPSLTPLPLIFDFHGIGGVIPEPPYLISSNSVLQGDKTPGIFVYPQGLDRKGDKGYGWWGTTSCSDYDIVFFDEMLAEISANYCIDLNRVFAGGFSFGASMSQALACCRGDVLRAIAPQAGGPCVQGACVSKCVSKSRPAARYSYGTGDKNTAGGDGAFPLSALRGAVDETRSALHCSDKTQSIPVRCDDKAPKCACVQYTGCDDAKPVIRCEYPGNGGDMHMYSTPDYPSLVWKFYSSFAP